MIQKDSHKFCIAPMLHCTDRHYRYLARLLTKKSRLYTEMITTGALIHSNRHQYLQIDNCEHPIALQLGGSNASELALCAEYASEYNYDEINLNVGCPSDRVQAGRFGACLMLEPILVADCIKAMKSVTDTEITVKTRIGVDEQDDYKYLNKFVDAVANAGCKTVIIHARKAYLSGLSPKENRTIPPLNYEYVYRLKRDFPELKIILNGGLKNKLEIKDHLQELNGVMIGREAYENLYFLADIDALFFDSNALIASRDKILEQYIKYIEVQLENTIALNSLTQHILPLFNGLPGARAWRRHISEFANKNGAGIEVLEQAREYVTIEQIELAS